MKSRIPPIIIIASALCATTSLFGAESTTAKAKASENVISAEALADESRHLTDAQLRKEAATLRQALREHYIKRMEKYQWPTTADQLYEKAQFMAENRELYAYANILTEEQAQRRADSETGVEIQIDAASRTAAQHRARIDAEIAAFFEEAAKEETKINDEG